MKKMNTCAVATAMLLFSVAQLYSQSDSLVTGPAGIRFVKIPAGNFVYGKFDPPYPKKENGKEYKGYRKTDFAAAEKYARRDARPGFEVVIPQTFYIGQFEVTQAQWKKVMNSNPSIFQGDSLPVDNISWAEAFAFTQKLNRMDDQHHYRLPTEFEWEYAARAGADDDISWDDIRRQAQLGTTTTQPVGRKVPNKWGLYDMLGNVWEWTADYYNGKLFADSFPAKSATVHVLKGASFTGDVKNATYMTHAAGPGNRWDVGLRIVMEEKPPLKKRSKTRGYADRRKRLMNDHIAGWHLSRTTHQGTVPKVTLENGVITLKQHPFGQGGVLLTNRTYKDFEMELEVKIDSFCNGGIFLRSTESGQAYQVELSEPGGTGSLFGEMLRISEPAEAKSRAAVWRANDWNHFRIRMTGDTPRIVLWINDSLMWDVQQPKNDFIAGASEGMIGLQVHWSATYSAAAKAFDMSSSWRPDGSHQFRNIRIRELPRR